MRRSLLWVSLGTSVAGCSGDSTSPSAATEGTAASETTSGPCAGVQCPAGEQCVEGVCMSPPCFTMPCCPWDSPCAETTVGYGCWLDEDCERGQACVDGECVDVVPPIPIAACERPPLLRAGAALPSDLVGAEAIAVLPEHPGAPARVVIAVSGGVLLAAAGDRAASLHPIGRGSDPVALAVADMDGDGTSDLVVSDFDAPALHVLLDDGLGGLLPVADAPMAWSAQLAAGDLDGDGDIDIALHDRDDERLLFHDNDGSGVLGAGSAVVSGNRDVDALLAAQLDRDLQSELVTIIGEEVTVWTDVAGSPTPFFPEPLPATQVVTADLDGDGLDDVVGDSSAIFGVWSSASALISRYEVEGAAPARRLARGDFDGDGSLDVVRVTEQSVEIWYSAPSGCIASYAAPFLVNLVAVGDLDADGRDDLVVGRADAIAVLSIAR